MNDVAGGVRSPIVWAVWDERRWSQFALAALGVCLLALSAKTQVPAWPVPMTMQTYVVLVIGMAYGTRLAVTTVLAYLVAGALGLPVFAGTPEKGIGLAYMAGPTGGYLVGFVVAAWLCGVLAARGWDRGFARSLVAMTAAHAVIFAFGVLWLAMLTGVPRAIALGLTPFIAATVVKTVLAGMTLPLAWRAVRRDQGRRHLA
ncbi:MAG TPA: biotin transporter BioY [Casimicrobiaceae bacterium]|nr:biotin transporter BioY [Casimicrobiaceae bacterium]HET9749471.1 biotin transporter BioY [Casimicrobiaceae bacterium]HWD17467.1 biotin transporter BioY [Casimicrobiaceae bacterium]HWD36431.1 biotin transporter BioY [Casimicrobiaceae bacterium]